VAGSGEPVAAPVATASAAPSARVPEVAYAKSTRPDEPRYARALAEADDPLEMQRLGLDAGASELVAALDDGGLVARVALAALPFAEDALLALGPLAERALAARAGAQKSGRTGDALPSANALLEVARALAERGPGDGEVADPEGVTRALTLFAQLAQDEALPEETRALAADAASAARGWWR
jgi:hypothetical protein